ncbi:hypothetical protein [Paracoccus contaminans]|uniref:hypothetical protein n=1 Tax=Paracoccus contaminans TaxID=1945662 RepID=UPI0012F49AC0|nr:hypothetical protein [Paracoccus contaminans]
MVNLAAYWSRLTENVHPDDVEIFAVFARHSFNLDHPPPAFVGDVLNAPVIILDNNGGYDEIMTPKEFASPDADRMFRASLADPRPIQYCAPYLSEYYRSSNYSAYLRSGDAALVNGVAYRSRDGRHSSIKALTGLLRSAQEHRRWLTETILPQVQRGERFVIVHRWARWGSATDVFRNEANAIFSRSPVSKNLSAAEILALDNFLRRRV